VGAGIPEKNFVRSEKLGRQTGNRVRREERWEENLRARSKPISNRAVQAFSWGEAKGKNKDREPGGLETGTLLSYKPAVNTTKGSRRDRDARKRGSQRLRGACPSRSSIRKKSDPTSSSVGPSGSGGTFLSQRAYPGPKECRFRQGRSERAKKTSERREGWRKWARTARTIQYGGPTFDQFP